VQSEDFDAVAPAPGDFVYINGYELLYPHATGLVNWVRRVRPDHLVFDPGPLIAEIDPEALDTILGATRWLSLNAAEAAALTGEADPTTAAVAALGRRRHDGGVVVRAGADGCVVATPGAEPRAVAAFPAEVVDTTGRGTRTSVRSSPPSLAGSTRSRPAAGRTPPPRPFVATRGQVSPPRLEELGAILRTSEGPS